MWASSFDLKAFEKLKTPIREKAGMTFSAPNTGPHHPMSNNNSIPLAQERHGGGPVSIFPNEPDCVIRFSRIDGDTIKLEVEGFSLDMESATEMQTAAIIAVEDTINMLEQYAVAGS